MWALVRLGLRYHRPTLVVATGIAALISTFLSLFARLDANTQMLNALWVFGTVLVQTLPASAMIAGFISTGIEREERRLTLLSVLPVTRRQVAAFRVALPLLPILAATAISIVIQMGLMALPSIEMKELGIHLITLTVSQLCVLVQVPLTIGDIRERRESGRVAESWGILLGLLAFSAAGAVVMLVVEHAVLRLALLWILVALLAGSNLVLFERRREFR